LGFLEKCFKDAPPEPIGATPVVNNIPSIENVSKHNSNNNNIIESNQNNNFNNNNNNVTSPQPPPAEISPEKQKLINIQVTVDSAIELLLQRLDAISEELNASTSIEETIEIAKIIRTAKRVLFTDDNSTTS
jgi:hypothetical protein